MRAEWRVVFGLDDIFLLARTKTRASGARTMTQYTADEGGVAGGFRAGRHFSVGQNENQSQQSPDKYKK